MHPVSPLFLAGLRSSHTAIVRVRVQAGSTTRNLPILGGSVQVDGGAQVRRTLDVTTAYSSWLVDVLMQRDTLIVAERGVRFPDGVEEWVPLGVFEAVSRPRQIAPAGTLSIRAADMFRRVQRGRFLLPVQTTGRAVTEALRLAGEAARRVTRDDCSSAVRAVRTRGALWDRDRAEAVTKLAASAGAEVYADPIGHIVARDVPQPGSRPSVWTVDASPTGVLLSGEDDETTDRVYNTVVVLPGNVDGGKPFTAVVIRDNNPLSPTYVGPGSSRREVPYFVSSELIRSIVQAREVGRATLARVSAPVLSTSVSTVVNPALEAGDAVTVKLPDGSQSTHLVESFSVPLTVEGEMTLTMRSSRPDGTDDEAA